MSIYLSHVRWSHLLHFLHNKNKLISLRAENKVNKLEKEKTKKNRDIDEGC